MGAGGQRLARPLYPRERDQLQLYRKLAGPQGRSGKVRKNSFPLGFDRRIVQPVANCYTGYALPAQTHVAYKAKYHSCDFLYNWLDLHPTYI
jgi:hypothetical protein